MAKQEEPHSPTVKELRAALDGKLYTFEEFCAFYESAGPDIWEERKTTAEFTSSSSTPLSATPGADDIEDGQMPHELLDGAPRWRQNECSPLPATPGADDTEDAIRLGRDGSAAFLHMLRQDGWDTLAAFRRIECLMRIPVPSVSPALVPSTSSGSQLLALDSEGSETPAQTPVALQQEKQPQRCIKCGIIFTFRKPIFHCCIKCRRGTGHSIDCARKRVHGHGTL